jgi:hypothetical protein
MDAVVLPTEQSDDIRANGKTRMVGFFNLETAIADPNNRWKALSGAGFGRFHSSAEQFQLGEFPDPQSVLQIIAPSALADVNRRF